MLSSKSFLTRIVGFLWEEDFSVLLNYLPSSLSYPFFGFIIFFNSPKGMWELS